MIFSKQTKKLGTLVLTTTRGQVLYNKNASKSTKACATRTSDLFSMVILAMMMVVVVMIKTTIPRWEPRSSGSSGQASTREPLQRGTPR